MRECDIHHTRSIKTNSAVNLSRKPGLDLAVTCCNIYREYHVPVFFVFTLSYERWFCSYVPSLKFSFIWNVTRLTSRIFNVDDSFWLILLDSVQHVAISCISHPSLISGYIVSVGRMVMDRIVLVKSSCWPWQHPGESPTYLSRGTNIEHARTAYHKLVELSINNHIVDCTILQMKYSTSAPNWRVSRITQLAKLGFNHPSVVLTAEIFQFLIKLQYVRSGWSVLPHYLPGSQLLGLSSL